MGHVRSFDQFAVFTDRPLKMPSGPFTGEDFQREGIRPVILAVVLAHARIWDEPVSRTFGWIIGSVQRLALSARGLQARE